jgi:hypothetical protein
MGANIPSSTTDLGEGEQHAPHLALVAQTILADGLEFGVTESLSVDLSLDLNRARSCSVARVYIQTSGLEWTSWDLVGLRVGTTVNHILVSIILPPHLLAIIAFVGNNLRRHFLFVEGLLVVDSKSSRTIQIDKVRWLFSLSLVWILWAWHACVGSG